MEMSQTLPRELAPGIFWLGECMVMPHKDDFLHQYISAYLVQGEEKSVLVDTGHQMAWPVLMKQVDGLLAEGVPDVAYIFPTHTEVPHSANLGRWLAKFPQAVAVGDVRDYHLIFPQFADRLLPHTVGDRFDLGGTELVLLEAIIRDLVTSLWGYDTTRNVLFPGDGFAYMHHHSAQECGKTAEEVAELPIPEFTALFAEHALYWTRFTDIEPHIRQLKALLSGERRIDVIAPGHGCPIVDPSLTVQKFIAGMRLGGASAASEVTQPEKGRRPRSLSDG